MVHRLSWIQYKFVCCLLPFLVSVLVRGKYNFAVAFTISKSNYFLLYLDHVVWLLNNIAYQLIRSTLSTRHIVFRGIIRFECKPFMVWEAWVLYTNNPWPRLPSNVRLLRCTRTLVEPKGELRTQSSMKSSMLCSTLKYVTTRFDVLFALDVSISRFCPLYNVSCWFKECCI